MSYQSERDDFIGRLAKAGIGISIIRGILSNAQTIQRLAVAQCNGDYPADNGEGQSVTCPQCEQGWRGRDTLKRYQGKGDPVCPDCRATRRIVDLMAGTGYEAVCSGDPRGYTVRLFLADSTREDRDSGRAAYIGVPVRDR